ISVRMSSKPTRYGMKVSRVRLIHHGNGRGMFIANTSPRREENMRFINAKSIGGSLLGFLLLFGTVMLSSATAQAQYWPNQDQYRRQRDYERAQRERERQIERQRREQERNGTWNNGTWNNGTWNDP